MNILFVGMFGCSIGFFIGSWCSQRREESDMKNRIKAGTFNWEEKAFKIMEIKQKESQNEN
jgi:hypothetical protein